MSGWFKNKTNDDYSLKGRTFFEGFQILFFIFMICAIGGFIVEVAYILITKGRLEYRGFLYGPMLPVYGFGGLAVYLLLNPLRKHPVFVILLSALITSIVEYTAGVLMYALYHQRWWDYSDHRFNINGFVSLDNTIGFALAGIFLIYCLIPVFFKIFNKLNQRTKTVLFFVFAGLLAFDIIMSNVIPNPFGTEDYFNRK